MVRESMTPADSRYFLNASFFCSVACHESRGDGEMKVREGWGGALLSPFQNGTEARRKPRDGCAEGRLMRDAAGRVESYHGVG